MTKFNVGMLISNMLCNAFQKSYNGTQKVFKMYETYYYNLNKNLSHYSDIGLIGGATISLPFTMYYTSDNKNYTPFQNTIRIITIAPMKSILIGCATYVALPLILYTGPIVGPICMPIYAYQKIKEKKDNNN